MFQTFKLAKELGVVVTAHCENAELVSRLQGKLIAEGKTGPRMARAEPPGIRRGGGYVSFHEFLREHRRSRLHCSSFLRARPESGGGGEGTGCEFVCGIGGAALPLRQKLCGASGRGRDAACDVAAFA